MNYIVQYIRRHISNLALFYASLRIDVLDGRDLNVLLIIFIVLGYDNYLL